MGEREARIDRAAPGFRGDVGRARGPSSTEERADGRHRGECAEPQELASGALPEAIERAGLLQRPLQRALLTREQAEAHGSPDDRVGERQRDYPPVHGATTSGGPARVLRPAEAASARAVPGSREATPAHRRQAWWASRLAALASSPRADCRSRRVSRRSLRSPRWITPHRARHAAASSASSSSSESSWAWSPVTLSLMLGHGNRELLASLTAAITAAVTSAVVSRCLREESEPSAS